MNVRGKTKVVEEMHRRLDAGYIQKQTSRKRARLSATKAYGTAGMDHELVEWKVVP